MSPMHNMLNIERKYWQLGFRKIAGVDEAGRGPLAGPVVAAAVILPPETVIPGLNDSKQLTALQRERLFGQIYEVALGVGIGTGSVEEIARLNIYGALMAAMREALAALPLSPEIVLVDGYPVRGLQIAQEAIKKGDTLSLSIAAASVIAKVTRDRFMEELHHRFPCYGFDRNKGYATSGHRRALASHGACCFHRQGFRLFGEEAREKEA